MNTTTKVLLTLLVVVAVAAVGVVTMKNTNLFKGQIFSKSTVTENGKLPDLKPTVTIESPDKNDNLRVRIKVENIGEGSVSGTNPYSYSLYVNDKLIMRNTDSFSTMNKGDSFSFIYPVDKAIYRYQNTGKVKVVIDEENKVKETDKTNNTSETAYEL